MEPARIELALPGLHNPRDRTERLRITAGLPLPAGRLSELSCLADFRIATVFILRRSRSFPAVSQQIETGGSHFGIAADGGQSRNRTGILPLRCGRAYLKTLPTRIRGRVDGLLAYVRPPR